MKLVWTLKRCIDWAWEKAEEESGETSFGLFKTIASVVLTLTAVILWFIMILYNSTLLD